MDQNYIVRLDNDARECRKIGSVFIHILHSAWQIEENDPRILEIKPVQPPNSKE